MLPKATRSGGIPQEDDIHEEEVKIFHFCVVTANKAWQIRMKMSYMGVF